VALATIALLPTTTGAMANTLAESMGLTTGYQIAPPATKPSTRQTRGSRIDHLEQVAARLRLRIQRLTAEGLEHRAATLSCRLSKLESELERLRQA